MTPIFRHLAVMAAFAAAPTGAQSFENLAMLDSRIAAALGAGIGEPGGAATPLDRRLRLAACPQPAEIGEPVAGALAVRCAAHGWRIRVALTHGSTTLATAAAAPVRAEPIIRRGDQVQLVAIGSSFAVSTLAIAEQDGAPGERIRLRTERRTTPVFGQVLADGRVALPGFN